MNSRIPLALCAVLYLLTVCPVLNRAAASSLTLPQVGDLATDVDVNAMEYAGYTVVDDRDAAITYTRPYTPDPVRITSGNRGTHTYQDSNHGEAFAYTERRRSSEHTLQPYHKHESGR